MYVQGGWGESVRPWLSRHLTLVSLEMGTRRQALMGRTAISLWEEAAPLERNRTGCDGGRDGHGFLKGMLVAWFRLALQVQVRHKPPPPRPVLYASRASIVVTLISASSAGQEASFCSSSPARSQQNPSNYFSSTCGAKTANWLRRLQDRTAGGRGLARRHQHGLSRLWDCSNEERELRWCCGSSTPCEYWSAVQRQRWKRSRRCRPLSVRCCFLIVPDPWIWHQRAAASCSSVAVCKGEILKAGVT